MTKRAILPNTFWVQGATDLNVGKRPYNQFEFQEVSKIYCDFNSNSGTVRKKMSKRLF